MPTAEEPLTLAPVQIEATAKRWKLLQLIGGVLIVLAVLVLARVIANGGPTMSSPNLIRAFVVFFVTGVMLYSFGRVTAWWYHG